MNIHLEKATIADAQMIFDMQVQAFTPLLEKYKDFDTNPANEPIDRIVTKINSFNSDFYKIVLGSEAVGAICVRWNAENEFRISPIFILPKYQGKGLAQKTILAVEGRYPQATVWTLDTILEEKGNCYLYEKMGYTQTGSMKKINEAMTLVFYKKSTKLAKY